MGLDPQMLIMLGRLQQGLKYTFSAYKNKLKPIFSLPVPSLKEFYSVLTAFEATLSSSQLVTYHKKVYDFNSKFNRILRNEPATKIPEIKMELNFTSEFFYCRQTELLFGTKQSPKIASLDELVDISASMLRTDLHIYYRKIAPHSHRNQSYFNLIIDRFTKIEEDFCRNAFQEYARFSQDTENVLFMEETVYKGDFKFVLVEDLAVIEKLSYVARNCAMFNQCRSKMTLAAEYAVLYNHTKLSPQALPLSGKPMKHIEDNLNEIYHKVYPNVMELLLYMAMSNTDDYTILKDASARLELFETNQVINEALRLAAKVFKEKQGVLLNGVQIKSDDAPSESVAIKEQSPEGEQFFQNFLLRDQYKYVKLYNKISDQQIYQIEGKEFIINDFMFYNEQFKFNGLSMILREYYVQIGNSNIKFLNWPRIIALKRRSERDDYIKSKFKGITRPQKVIKRWYD